MKLGFIGLGHLGTPIAENLLEKKHSLYVYNRTASKAQSLIDKGATLCKSVKELATECDIVFTIVSDDAAVNHITKEAEGLAANLKPGGIHVSMSTILPETSKQLYKLHEQHGNHYIACPIMGRPEAARARKLNILASGSKATLEIIKPFLQDAGAAKVWEFGDDTDASNVAKLCGNFLIISAIEAMAESINLAGKSGLDAGKWTDMITQTLFPSPIYINYGKMILEEAFAPGGFSVKLGLKDVNLVLQQAKALDAKMPFGNQLKHQMDECVEKGYGDNDWTAIAMALK